MRRTGRKGLDSVGGTGTALQGLRKGWGGETEELRGLNWGEGWIGTLRGCACGPGVRRLGPTPSLPLQLGEERLGFRRPRSRQDLPQPPPWAWAVSSPFPNKPISHCLPESRTAQAGIPRQFITVWDVF